MSLALLRTALTPAIWGTTYAVTTLLLPDQPVGWMVIFRILPAGLLLLMLSRRSLTVLWYGRAFILGLSVLGLTYFVFLAAYRLPGGMAGTLIATLPLQTIFYMWVLRGHRPNWLQICAGLGSIAGVALLLLNAMSVDLVGVLASFMACLITFLMALKSKDWGLPEQGIVVYVGWQLTLAGLIVSPAIYLLQGPPPDLTFDMALAFTWIGLLGVGWASVNWLKGILLYPVTTLSFLSLVNPIAAVLCGQLLVGEAFGLRQWFGIAIILGSILLATRAQSQAIKPITVPSSQRRTWFSFLSHPPVLDCHRPLDR